MKKLLSFCGGKHFIEQTVTDPWISLSLTGSWFSIKTFTEESTFNFDAEKNMANKTQVCNQKIWIKETLSLQKAIAVITENVLLLKYQKQAIKTALNWEDTLMLLPSALRKSWIHRVLVSRNSLPIGIKFPDLEFYWGADHKVYSRLGI